MTQFLATDNALAVVRGATRSYSLTVTDDDGAAVDLTGARLLCSVKGRRVEQQPVIRKDSQVSSPHPAFTTTPQGARGGQATLNFYPEDTHHLDAGVYVYDLWVLFEDGRRVPVIPDSTLEVLDSITQVPLS